MSVTDDICAADRDSGKVTAAIVAADSECASYRLEAPDAGVGGGAGTGGAETTGGAESGAGVGG